MKKMLSDYIKSQEEFERFCNMFLKKEVSPLVKVYEVPGPDGGIDAEYHGPYAGKEGHWVFQCKYRNPINESSSRSSIIRVMKKDKGELSKADASNCNHYILITNIKLTVGNVNEIRNVKTERDYTFSLDFWDGADLINTTLSEFPYLLKPPHLSIFLPWQEMFRYEVAGKKPLLRYDYDTFGREDEIRHFQNFIEDPVKRLLVIFGSGGIGKTKLGIECAKKVEQDYKDYDPLFIRVDTRNFENAIEDILPSRKYIFFIDDAHDFVDNFGNLIAILNSEDYKDSKVVLITRKSFKTSLKGYFLSALPDGAIDEREVAKLPPEKTEEFVQKYAKESLPEGLLLAGLTRIGRDTPLIAVMVIDALNKKLDLGNLTETELVEYMFESYLPELDSPRRRLLNWLSGIAPIDAENTQIRDKLAELLKVEPHEIEWYRDDLLKDGLLLQAGRKQRVFPDPLGDYILGKACILSNQRPSSFHERLLEEFLPILPVNVITNLARVENVTGESTLLDTYIQSLKSQVRDGDNAVREYVLEHIEGICYFRPDDAIDIFNIILDNPNSEDSETHYSGWISRRTHQHLLQKITKESQKTINTLSGFRGTLKIIKQLIQIKDLELQNYDMPHELLKRMAGFQTNKPGIFQDKVLEMFEEWKDEDIPNLTLALLHSLNSLLVLDFSETVSQGSSVEFGWHHLQYNTELIELRTRAIDLIENCLNTSRHSIVKKEAIGSISRAINPLDSPSRQDLSDNDQAKLQEEQARLYNIIADQIAKGSDFTVLNAIERCLNGYADNTYIDGFPKERAAELLLEFGKHKDYERYRFYKQFTGEFQDWEMLEQSDKTREFLEKYLDKYTPEQLSELMRECIDAAEKSKEQWSPMDGVWDEKGWNPGSATSILQNIGEFNPNYGYDLLNYIVDWQIPQSHCASGLLRGIRLSDKDKAQEATDHLLSQNNIYANRIVARSYLRTNRGKQCFEKRDLDILDQLSKIPDSQLQKDIAESLPNFYSVDTELVLEMLVKLTTDESPAVKREVLSALDCKKFEFSAEKHLEKLKHIAHNCLDLERIYHEFEQVLHTIFNCDPIWVIEFLEKRIAYKENGDSHDNSCSDQSVNLSGYDAVPQRPHHLFSGINWNDENVVKALNRVRNWSITSTESQHDIVTEDTDSQTETQFSNTLRFEAPMLLVSIVGGDDPTSDEVKMNGTMKTLFEEWIESDDIELMREVAYLMKYFAADATFYSLAETLLIKSGDDEQVKGGITAVLWSRGHSKSIGEPSPYFEKQIEELKAWRDRTQSRDVAKFADSCIEMIQKEIDRELLDDEEFLDTEGY